MYLIKLNVTYKESILDPQGQSICQACHQLGFMEVNEVRMGKYFEVTVDSLESELEPMIEALCEQLLVNHTMETYEYEIVPLSEVHA